MFFFIVGISLDKIRIVILLKSVEKVVSECLMSFYNLFKKIRMDFMILLGNKNYYFF